MLTGHGGDDSAGTQCTSARRWSLRAHERTRAETKRGRRAERSPPSGNVRTAGRSGREARSAAAGVLGVRVLEGEPALPELSLDVVDLDPQQVHRAHRVDEA